MRKPSSVALIGAVLASLFAAAPAQANGTSGVTYVASTGSDNNTNQLCSRTAPCQTFAAALSVTTAGGAVNCLDPLLLVGPVNITTDVTIDCSQTQAAIFAPGNNRSITINAAVKVTLRGLAFYTDEAFNGVGGILVSQGTSLRVENCKFFGFIGAALDIEPNGPFSLVVSNSPISTSGAGALLKPAPGGSINATFDRVTIAQNSGGGVKTDTTLGAVTIDMTDSVVSNNGGNGINAVAGAFQNIVSIKNSVIARNGAAGAQANGANAGVLIATTLLDQNAAGATTVTNGGNMFSYGNNQIVGPIGAGFNQTAQLH
jgi:hypothetical protein